jgi:TonB family protein
MKKIIAFAAALCLLISNTSFAQIDKTAILKHENDVFRSSFKQNKIRGYINKKYNFVDKKIADTVFEYELVLIDTSGNIVQSAVFNKYQELLSLDKLDYNQKNQNVKTYTFEKTSLLYKTQIWYDIYGKPVEEVETDDFGAIHSKRRHSFNSKGKPVKTTVKGPSGIISSEATYVYNQDGLLTKHSFMNAGKTLSSLEFEYENGKLLRSIFFNDKYKTKAEKSYTYGVDLPVEISLTEKEVPFLIRRTYFKQGQEPQLIEKILLIPDFNKYYKDPNNYSQHFVYQTPPSFPGGEDALINYVKQNFKYPKKPLKAGIQGLSVISFAIDEMGNIANIRVTKSVEYEIDDASVELVRNMPKWKPALNDKGKPCMSSVDLPIDYIIE